jgi:hypothetical protein
MRRQGCSVQTRSKAYNGKLKLELMGPSCDEKRPEVKLPALPVADLPCSVPQLLSHKVSPGSAKL